MSQTRSPILCHSWKHRLGDWGSGDLLLLSGLCPKGPCHHLPQNTGRDHWRTWLRSWKCWCLNGHIKAPLASSEAKRQFSCEPTQPQVALGHLTDSQWARCLSEMKPWLAFLHISLRSSNSYISGNSIRCHFRGWDNVLVKV